jgi:uncharacterized protein (DUF1800 family)
LSPSGRTISRCLSPRATSYSIGPEAAPGKFGGRGLKENLAREILELHTLGVGSGYTQADVTELARGVLKGILADQFGLAPKAGGGCLSRQRGRSADEGARRLTLRGDALAAPIS